MFPPFLLFLLVLPSVRLEDDFANVTEPRIRYRKPSFTPYCQTNSECSEFCECSFAANCFIETMGDKMRVAIVQVHNQHRQGQTLSQPMASGMMALRYNMPLEEAAQCWVAQCRPDTTNCFISPDFENTEMNIATMPMDTPLQNTRDRWQSVIARWNRETYSTNVESIVSFPNDKEDADKLRSFAIMNMDYTMGVGCAVSRNSKEFTFACVYGPSELRPGSSIYKIGMPCSTCRPGYQCLSNSMQSSLCVKVDIRAEKSGNVRKSRSVAKGLKYSPWLTFIAYFILISS